MVQEVSSAPADQTRVMSSEPVMHWASQKYIGDSADAVKTYGLQFEMEIDDQRKSSGQAWMTTAAEGGEVDDMLSVCMEVSSLPGMTADLPVLHVHFGGDDVAFSVFKVGQEIVIRLEHGVSMTSSGLDDGTEVFVLK